MAEGHQHELHGCVASVVFGFALGALSLSVGKPHYSEAIAATLGIIAGTWLLSPDLDMWRTRPTRRWLLLKYLWAPYAWAFRHRGISHGWILGPLSRLIYIGAPVGCLWYYAWGLQGLGPWLYWALGGVVVGNWIHLLGDGMLPFRKSGL